MEKSAVRKDFRARLQAMTESDKAKAGELVCQKLQKLHRQLGKLPVVGYWPTASEVDIRPFLESLTPKHTLYLPVFDALLKVYRLAEVTDPKRDLVRGRYEIMEPAGHLPVIHPQQLEQAIWLVPGLGFSENGVRLGRGGGYYDRLLEGLDHQRVGIAFDRQIAESLPLEEHDIRMHQVVTDQRILVFD